MILVISYHPLEDGRIAKEIKALEKTGHSVMYLNVQFAENQIANSVYSNLMIQCISSVFSKILLVLGFHPGVLGSIIKCDPRVIHVHDPILLTCSLVYKLFRFNKVKIVYDRHEYFEKMRFLKILPLYYWIEKFVSIFCDYVICVNPAHLNSSRKLLFVKNGLVVSNYPENNNTKHYIDRKINNYLVNNTPIFSYVGSLNGIVDRDMHLMLAVIREVLKRKLGKVILAGRSPDEDTVRGIREIQCEFDEFEYLGEIDRKMVAEINYCSQFGFFMIKSELGESYSCSPNKVYEYLENGVIPIISAVVDDLDFLKDRLGLIYPPFYENMNARVHLIISRLETLLSDRNNVVAQMELSFETSGEFGWQQESDKLIKMYKEIL